MTSQLKYPLESQKSRFSNAFFTLCALLHGAFRGVVNLLIIIKINEWKIYESRKQSPFEAVSSSPAVWNWSQEHPEDDVITSDAFSSLIIHVIELANPHSQTIFPNLEMVFDNPKCYQWGITPSQNNNFWPVYRSRKLKGLQGQVIPMRSMENKMCVPHKMGNNQLIGQLSKRTPSMTF